MAEIRGIGGASGQAVGRIVVLKEQEYTVECEQIQNPGAEVEKLEEARDEYRREMAKLYEETRAAEGEEAAAIFQAYKEMADDDIFFQQPVSRVREESINMEFALEEEKKKVASVFLSMEDPYMKERGTDIENVCNALIKKMKGISSPIEKIRKIKEDFIVAAEDLAPADTVRLDKRYLRGFVTERGGRTSHTVILAKTLGIPAVVGAAGIMESARDGEKIWIDGDAGRAILDPSEETMRQYEYERQQAARRKEMYDEVKKEPAVTTDGHRLQICVNSGDRESLRSLAIDECDGVGLFRTEFLYMSGSEAPTEEFQYEVYRELAEKAGGKEVIIRTLDIGGDKQIDYMDLPKEQNPFLGYRAIRICLDKTELFKTQLRAILRASAHGKVSVMFPMIVNLEELRQARSFVRECQEELDAQGYAYDKEIRIGIMIETPAAVLLSDKLAAEADFFSIGTNDLIQYITATDRMNERTQYLYRICNLSVLRAVKTVADNAHRAGIPVGICGESASDERMTCVWLGLGIDELSMVSGQTSHIKYIIRHTSKKEAQEIAEKVLDLDTAGEVEQYLDRLAEEQIR